MMEILLWVELVDDQHSETRLMEGYKKITLTIGLGCGITLERDAMVF